MKFIASLILMALLSFTACLYLPWWSIAVVCFIVSLLIRMRPGWAFLCGLLSLFILWGALIFWISSNNQHLLAHKLSQIIIKKDNPNLLIILSAVIGAIVGGTASLSGSLLRSVITKY